MRPRALRPPLLGVTMGDPCGIGPELVLRLLADRAARRRARYTVFGSAAILERVAAAFHLPLPAFRPAQAGDDLQSLRGPLLVDATPCPPSLALRGQATSAGGRASLAWIEQAIRCAQTGAIDGIVTAPINKAAVLKGGAQWPGHTEMLAALTGAPKPVMMMAGDTLRVALVTTHAAVAELPRLITRRAVLDTLLIADRDLRRFFGLRRPRLMVCGLNPHAGEGGRFGPEEARAIAPAIRAARRRGVTCEGPLPADVVFTRRIMPRYDAAVAMYHDQATIPVKLLAVESGVNVTLGLPIVRTSPDHGTAYDIARRGIADPRSMFAAAAMAADMAALRRARR